MWVLPFVLPPWSPVHHTAFTALLFLSGTSVPSGAIACDAAIGSPALILKKLGKKGVEGGRLFATSLTRLNTIPFCIPVWLEQAVEYRRSLCMWATWWPNAARGWVSQPKSLWRYSWHSLCKGSCPNLKESYFLVLSYIKCYLVIRKKKPRMFSSELYNDYVQRIIVIIANVYI